MHFVKPAVAFAAALAVSGCASIISKSEYPTTFHSNPPGAKVTITDEHGVSVEQGRTPFTTTLDAGEGYFNKRNYTAAFEYPCYREKDVAIHPGIDGWYWGNFLFGGVIGLLIVDPATGAMYKIKPNYTATLQRSASAGCSQPTAAVAPPLRGEVTAAR